MKVYCVICKIMHLGSVEENKSVLGDIKYALREVSAKTILNGEQYILGWMIFIKILPGRYS